METLEMIVFGIAALFAVIDFCILAAAIHRWYHSMFNVIYFSLDAWIKELFTIALVAGSILYYVPMFLSTLVMRAFNDNSNLTGFLVLLIFYYIVFRILRRKS